MCGVNESRPWPVSTKMGIFKGSETRAKSKEQRAERLVHNSTSDVVGRQASGMKAG